MSREAYDVAQICLNGHVINESSVDFPHHNQDYCHACGAKTVTQCPACSCPIRGYPRGSMTMYGGGFPAPAFCHNCGQPFPWTQLRLEAARQLTEGIENLSQAEKQTLNDSIGELVKDTPMTPVAANRFKGLVAKAGPAAAGVLREVLVTIMTEAAKQQIWG